MSDSSTSTPDLAARVAETGGNADGRPADPAVDRSVAPPSTETLLNPSLVRFGAAVAASRKRHAWTQTDVADALDINRVYFSHIENGKAPNLSLRLAYQISDLLGVPVDSDHGTRPLTVDEAVGKIEIERKAAGLTIGDVLAALLQERDALRASLSTSRREV